MQSAGAIGRAATRGRKLDIRATAGLLIMLVAVMAGWSIIGSAKDTTEVVVAARAVAAGDVIGKADLRIVEVSLSRGVRSIPATSLEELIGQPAAAPLQPGQLLTPGSIAETPPMPAGTVAMTLDLDAADAVGGRIVSGDRVAAIATPARADAQEKRSTILLTDVLVVAVAEPDHGEGVLVTLAVRLEQANAMAQARAEGDITLVLMGRGDA